MLNLMRKHAQSWFIKFLLGAIVFVFVLWGGYSYRSQKAARVAVVDGEAVSVEEFNEAYRRMVEQLRQQFGNSLNEDLIKMFRILFY